MVIVRFSISLFILLIWNSPPFLESAYFLHRSSKGFQTQFRSRLNNHTSDSSGWVWAGDFALHTLEKLTRTECGYASVKNVSPKTSGKLDADQSRMKLMDEMPSFFLSETLKYLYLLFDDNNMNRNILYCSSQYIKRRSQLLF